MLAHAVLAAADRFIAIPTQLERHGCTGLQPARLGTPHGSAGSATLTPPGPSEGLRVEDPRNLRRKLEGALASQRAQDAFVAGLAEVVADEGTLRRALLPMINYANGDSLLRMTLNMQRVQSRVASLLLEKLPEFCGDSADGGGALDGAAGPHDGTSIPSLILGQLRWLEAVVDAGGLTDKVLQVLPVCPPQVQQQLVGFLPEVASPEEHERVVEALLGLLEQDTGFVACVLDAVGDMQLEPGLQAHAVESLGQQLQAVDVDDLPALVRFLLANTTPHNAQDVAAGVRACLHCASPTDPRLAVPDSKQKGPAGGRSKVLAEARVLRELGAALQASDPARGGLLKAVGALSEPRQHRAVDLWALLLIWQHGASAPQHARAAEALLRRKVLEGQAGARWLEGAVWDHQAVVQDLWQPFLGLAAAWSRAKEPQLRVAAGQLYRCLFVRVDSTPHRQEVLQALHGHLGSGQQQEEDVALEALLLLAHRHTELLARFGAFLASILDHLECFSDTQLRQVFEMFAALTAPSAGGASGSSGSAGFCQGGRFEDELHITLTKALAHTSPVYKRIGIVGGLAMLRREAAAYAAAVEGCGPGEPDAVAAGIPQLEAAGPSAAVGAGATAAAPQQLAPEASAPLPQPLASWLSGRVQDLLYEGGGFLADKREDAVDGAAGDADAAALFAPGALDTGDSKLTPALWFNLDGPSALCALKVLPIAASNDPRERAKLLWLAPLLRLLAALTQQVGAQSGAWASLPGASRLAALGALFHAVAWVRETVNCFAPQIGAYDVAMATQAAQDDARMQSLAEHQTKVLARLVQLRQLEELLQHLAATGTASEQLPDLAHPLSAAALRGAGAAGGAGTSAGGSKDGQGKGLAGPKPDDVMRKLRCLELPSLQALHAAPSIQAQLSVLLPAAHLVADLQAKLKAVLGRARRPTFAAAAAAQLPPCLESVGPAELARQLEPLLPALQQHLSLAVATIREPPEGPGAELLTAGLPGFDDAASRALSALDCTSRPLDVGTTAHELALSCMRVLTTLVGPAAGMPSTSGQPLAQPGQEQQQQQQLGGTAAAALSALAPAAGAAASSSEGVPPARLAAAAFDAAARLSCLPSGLSDLELEMALLELQAAIIVSAGAPPASKLRKKLSRAAEALLQETWAAGADEAEEEGKGFSWKGQNAAISRLLALWAGHAPDPSATLQQLAGLLKKVPGGKVAAKEQLAPIEGYAALCVATFPTWYRVVFEQLVALAEHLSAQALAFVSPQGGEGGADGGPAAAAAGGASGRGKGAGKKPSAAAAAATRLAECKHEEVDAVMSRYQRAAQCFSALVELSKTHQNRTGLLGQAIKQGGRFVDQLIRALPFWHAAHANGGQGAFESLIKDAQRGTKLLQNICNEAKAKRSAQLLSRAPAVKKSMERWLYEMRALYHELGLAGGFQIGNLKNRDLGGTVVSSQMFCSDDGEDDEEEAAEEEYVEEGDEEEAEEAEDAGGEEGDE
ncbi:hypothetical protein MNEG_6459 [Monoraphidium neglectum]|uniref:Fanconi anemia group D2 protein n=1 Tax=Monoraphidium neglectum TaxID=145388 RepID=A0A0D2MLR8_9CHLO|nr:hypothetical protein MNEG_6459 [Monoraphidium neglectum]KIZ01502.1 hypothetical protein MNEG_6459 [Monoraphidium neglectum]|eukprot:XP_013900521.1 hypothetical protein MNEG_6459 [Monoraphidium neglectum]